MRKDVKCERCGEPARGTINWIVAFDDVDSDEEEPKDLCEKCILASIGKLGEAIRKGGS